MRLIGFIKEHNNIEEAVAFSDIKDTDNNYQEITKIIDYLNDGILVLGWMGYFTDIEDREVLISPDSYYTDGVYIWPKYFPYYLKKYPNMFIAKEFENHIIEKEFKIKKDIDINKIEDWLSKKL